MCLFLLPILGASFKNKMNFRVWVNICNPHFILGTGTWLSSETENQELVLDKDCLIYWKSRLHSRGGGALIAVKKCFHSALEELKMKTDIGIIWVHVKVSFFLCSCRCILKKATCICLYHVITCYPRGDFLVMWVPAAKIPKRIFRSHDRLHGDNYNYIINDVI